MKKAIFFATLLSVSLIFALTAFAIDYPLGTIIPEGVKVTKYGEGEVDLLKDIKGSNKLLVFFNTACAQCLKEIKWLVDNVDISKLRLVSIDMIGEPAVIRYEASFLGGVGAIFYVDPDFELAQSFGLTYTPSTIMIDKDGKVVSRTSGYERVHQAKYREFLK